MLSVITFIIVLSILVLVHELGHFYAARRAGILVEEFGFGLPPRVWGKKIGETVYSINLLPFGGFVRLHGENTEDEIEKPKRAFLNQSKKVRTSVVLAGVFMNFVLAIAAFSLVYSFSGIPRQTGRVEIVETAESSPAAEAGIQSEDIIQEVEGQPIFSNQEFIAEVDQRKGEEIALTIARDGQIEEVQVTPRENPPEGEGALGVIISSTEIYYPPIWQRPFYGIYYGFQEAVFWGGAVIGGFVQIFSNLLGGQVPEGVAGPVGIYALTSEAARIGVLALVNFVGILSVNLAILNAIPFPALDGGRLLFILIESFFGKRVVPKVEATIHTVGIIILILLILAITANDIQTLIQEGGVAGYIETVLPQ